jgi:hypothetical protein
MEGGIGNAVEATPLVQAIRTTWPAAHVTVRAPGGDLLDDWCIVDRIAKTWAELDGQAFDHAFVTWSGGVAHLPSGCRPGQTHYTEAGLELPCTKPEREYNMDMLRRLGYAGPTPPLYVSLREPATALPGGRPRIALAPGGKPTGKWRHKRWPYFAELAEALLRQHVNAAICLVGTADDEVPAALTALAGVADLRGRLTLRETAWVLRSSDLVIGNDCGPMHVADAVRSQGLVLFGPTDPVKNGPLYSVRVVRAEVPCAPCQYGNRLLTCTEPACMAALEPAMVLRHAKAVLDGRRQAECKNA